MKNTSRIGVHVGLTEEEVRLLRPRSLLKRFKRKQRAQRTEQSQLIKETNAAKQHGQRNFAVDMMTTFIQTRPSTSRQAGAPSRQSRPSRCDRYHNKRVRFTLPDGSITSPRRQLPSNKEKEGLGQLFALQKLAAVAAVASTISPGAGETIETIETAETVVVSSPQRPYSCRGVETPVPAPPVKEMSKRDRLRQKLFRDMERFDANPSPTPSTPFTSSTLSRSPVKQASYQETSKVPRRDVLRQQLFEDVGQFDMVIANNDETLAPAPALPPSAPPTRRVPDSAYSIPHQDEEKHVRRFEIYLVHSDGSPEPAEDGTVPPEKELRRLSKVVVHLVDKWTGSIWVPAAKERTKRLPLGQYHYRVAMSKRTRGQKSKFNPQFSLGCAKLDEHGCLDAKAVHLITRYLCRDYPEWVAVWGKAYALL